MGSLHRQRNKTLSFDKLRMRVLNEKVALVRGKVGAQGSHMDIHVYILRCSDGSYYVGLTKAGLDKRMAEHHSGTFEGYTSKRLPVTLVWNQHYLVLTQAIECERRLKGWRREKKEALIRGDYRLLPALSRTAKSRSPKTQPSS